MTNATQLASDSGYGYSAYSLDQIDSPLSGDQSIELGLTQDDQSVQIDLEGNAFRFYGQDYTSAWVSSNGKISFESGNSSYSNAALSTTSNPEINVFWDDLYPNSVNRGYYTIVNNELVIDWQLIPHIGNITETDTATFQAILGLNTGADDGYIILNYYDVTFGHASYDYGASASIGIAGPEDYLQLSYDSTSFLEQYDSVLVSSTGFVDSRQALASASAGNTAPSSSGAEVSTTEDIPYHFTASDFAFSDPDSGDSLKAILIVTTPASGQLAYNDEIISAGESGYLIDAARIEYLKFIPSVDESGSPYTSFEFKVLDQSDALSDSATITINVAPENDAPVTYPAAATIDEDEIYTFNRSDFGFSDPDDGDSLKAVLIVSNPSNGQLFFDNELVVVDDAGYQVAVAELDRLTFIPNKDESGDSYDTFDFVVIDQSDTQSVANAFTINVNPVNDPPLILTSSASILEDDFSSSSDGWSHGSLVTSPEWGSFLGTFGAGQSTSKTFSESTPIKSITFDWLRLDSWDGETFKIKANGIEIFSENFSLNTNVTSTSSGTSSGYSWTLVPHEFGGSYWGSSGWSDQRFRISITPPEGTTDITLELLSTLDQAANDEAWGIDNFVVETQGSIYTGTVIEAGTDDDGSSINGITSVSEILSATDVDTDSSWSWSIEGTPSTTYGFISIDALSGRWTYELDNSLGATQALAEGESVEELFVARVTDDAGAYAEQNISITVIGSNDGPVITSDDSDHTGSVREAGHSAVGVVDPGNPSITGTLTAFDVDADSLLTWSVVGQIDTTYGTISIDPATGQWHYVLDNTKTALQALASGDTRTLFFTARVTDQYDAYTDQEVEITINGTDDVVRQYADYVIGVSSEGQAGGGDRWSANQSLGAPNTEQFADLDTAWSPRERNAAGGSEADEYLALGFKRPVHATGVVIHESFGNGFVRRVDAIDTDGDIHELWTGEDDSPSELFAFTLNLDQPTDYLVNGLRIWVDTDHTSDWEQIDAVELIGWAALETYQPLPPTLDPVAGNNVVNADEKAQGLVLTGNAEANSTVELTWGDTLYTALVGADRRWSLTVEPQNIPADIEQSTITLAAVDSEGYRSNPTSRLVRINTAAPAVPQIDPVAIDNRINTYEKLTGVLLQGSAVGTVSVQINWDSNVFNADVSDDGRWSVLIGGPDGVGEVPPDSIASEIHAVAVDSDGNRSELASHSVVIDTRTPLSPSLDDVTGDNIVNATEKSAGIILSGRSECGTTVTVQWGSVSHEALSNDDGYWSLNLSSNDIPTDERRSRITLSATDLAGNQSTPNRQSVSIDTDPPEQPVINQLNSYNLINLDNHRKGLTLAGTAEKNSIVNISWNNRHFSTTTASSGRWTYLVESDLLPGDGSSTIITASATDAAGNQSSSAIRTVVVDLSAPNAPTLNPVGNAGIINASLKSEGFTIGGAAEAGAIVNLSWDRLKKEIIADSGGLWSVRIASGEVPRDGLSVLSLTATDLAGNQSTVVHESILVDTKPPRAPRFSGRIAGDNVISAAERESGVLIQGTTDSGNQISVRFAGITKQAIVTGTEWQVMFASAEIPIDERLTQAITAFATDAVGNQSTPTSVDVVLRTAPPAAPVIDTIGSKDQVNASDKVRGVTVTGTVGDDANSVEVTWGTHTRVVNVKRGRWATVFDQSDIPADGINALYAVALAGGVRSAESARSVYVDSLVPDSPTLNPIGAQNVIDSSLYSRGLQLSGTAEPGDLVYVLWDGVERKTLANESGIWEIDYSPLEIPPDNASSYVAVFSEDQVGNRSAKVLSSVLIDTRAPIAPTLDAVTGDNVITVSERNTGITLSGRAESSSLVTLEFGSYITSVQASLAGAWSHTLSPSDLPSDGQSTAYKIFATDIAGNTSQELIGSVALAYSASTAPTIDPIMGDNVVNASEAKERVVITGTGEVSSRIKLSIGSKVFSTIVDNKGLWSVSLRRSDVPSSDGLYEVAAISTNQSGLQSLSGSRSISFDRQAPSILSASIEDSTVILHYSEDLTSNLPGIDQFAISTGRRSALVVQSALIDQGDPSTIRLRLASAPTADTGLSITYTPGSVNDQVADLAGNQATRFRSLVPQLFTTSSDVNTLASGYLSLHLKGSSHLRAIANGSDNIVVGNDGDNFIDGGGGADVLTGGQGRDVFKLARLSDSLLGTSSNPGYDRITDFSIGTDVIDGPSPVARGQVVQLSPVDSLTSTALAQSLSSQVFVANAAAVFSYNDSTGERWFLALNDNIAGFNASRDAIIELTGFSGSVSNLQVL